jgi:hypothetical protein
MRTPLNFDAMITGGAEQWREVESALDAAEKHVANMADDPESLICQALTAFAFARFKQESLQPYLRERFGIELDDPLGSEASRLGIRVVDKERARGRYKTLEDVVEETDVVISLMMYNAAVWSMEQITWECTRAWLAKEANARWWARFGVACPVFPRSYAASASLAAYFYVMHNGPIMYAGLARGDWDAGFAKRTYAPRDRLQEAATGLLAAWVRARIKLYPSLKAALSEEGQPQEVLVRELPGAILEELAVISLQSAGGSPADVCKEITNRVSRRLRASGSEAKELLKRAEKLAEDPLEADSMRNDFELRELAREQLDTLEEAAQLSPQQTEVWRRLRMGMGIEQIGAELDIPKTQVSVVKHEAMRKLSKVAGL